MIPFSTLCLIILRFPPHTLPFLSICPLLCPSFSSPMSFLLPSSHPEILPSSSALSFPLHRPFLSLSLVPSSPPLCPPFLPLTPPDHCLPPREVDSIRNVRRSFQHEEKIRSHRISEPNPLQCCRPGQCRTAQCNSKRRDACR